MTVVSPRAPGPSTLIPMKPHTTEGTAARSSITILSVSFVRLRQNSDTNTAAPRPKGTAMTMESSVTLSVPTISAPAP